MRPIVFILLLFFACCFGSAVFAQDKQNKKQPAAVEEVVSPEMTVVDGNRLRVRNAPVGRKVEIFTILGNKVRQIEIKSSEEEYELKLPRAIYIFRMDEVVRKYVIR